MSRICVKGLSPHIDEGRLKRAFSERGEITDVLLLRKNGKSRGVAFIGYRHPKEAMDAQEYFNLTFIDTSKISVEIAKREGDASLPEPRSRHSKAKRKAETHNASLNDIEQDGKHLDDVKSRKRSRKEEEFLKIMQPRNTAKMWDNDAAVIADNQSFSSPPLPATTDLDDADKADTGACLDVGMSDMDYLKSKIVPSNSSSLDIPKPTVVDDIDPRRIFVHNLPLVSSIEEVSDFFSAYSQVSDVFIPKNEDGRARGIAFVTFEDSRDVSKIINQTNGSDFQGKLILTSPARRLHEIENLNDGLSLFQRNQDKLRRRSCMNRLGWNASKIDSSLVVNVISERLGVSKGEYMDHLSSSDLAVRLSLGEAQIIAENRDFFLNEGLDLSCLDSTHHSSNGLVVRSRTAFLIKNLPPSVNEDQLSSLFAMHGSLIRFVTSPSKSIALVEYSTDLEANNAFKRMAYKRFESMPLLLEWAPMIKNFKPKMIEDETTTKEEDEEEVKDEEKEEEEDSPTSIFIKSLDFAATEELLRSFLESKIGCDVIRSIHVPCKPGNSKQILGYGFVEFKKLRFAESAIRKLNGVAFCGRTLEVVLAKKSTTAASKTSVTSSQRKIIIKNLAFQVKPHELRQLFSAYGQIKSVRLPRKQSIGNSKYRGFGFVEFLTHNEAETAMRKAEGSHLYGRRLVLEWAKPEVEL